MVRIAATMSHGRWAVSHALALCGAAPVAVQIRMPVPAAQRTMGNGAVFRCSRQVAQVWCAAVRCVMF